MKKLLLSSVIVLCSCVIVSAQTNKNIYGSKAQQNVVATVQSPAKAVPPAKQKTDLEQKAAIKKETLNAAAAKPKSAMSLVEAQH